MKQRLQKKQKQQNRQMVLEFMHTLNVEILSSFNPELHLKNTEASIKNKLKDLLNGLRVFKYFITLVEKLKKTINKNETKYRIFYSNSKAKTIIYNTDIDSAFESIYSMIMPKCKNIRQKAQAGLY